MNMKSERIILDKFIRTGDRVVVDYTPDEDISYQNLPPAGTLAIAIDTHSYYDYVDLKDLWMPSRQQPGVYLCLGAMQYIFQINGIWERRHISAHYLVFEDGDFDPEVRRDDQHWKLCDTGVYIGPLPELEFSIGDEVSWNYPDVRFGRMASGSGKIVEINWRDIGTRCGEDKSHPYPIYVVQEENGGRIHGLKYEFFQLRKRGNYHWWKHGKSYLSFKDLNEEASFYSSLGQSEELRNAANGVYSWTIDEALAALEAGTADAVSVRQGFFGAPASLSVKRFHLNRDLGERIRAETLKNFKDKIPKLGNLSIVD